MTLASIRNSVEPDLSRRAADAPRRTRRRQQAGQSVLIVLGVLFLVAFLGALFVLVVIRNLENAQRQNQVLTADYYAQAGVDFANHMLETSPLGADWRPPLQYDLPAAMVSQVPGYVNPGTLTVAPVNDPDKRWLDQGYTRYNLTNGRFLLRVTYNPAGASAGATATAYEPASKYLKIDVVGRQGNVDSSDPTTYTNSPSETLRAERIAYKPLGLVDYARFITNKDNTSATAELGVPSSYDSTNKITTPGVMDISAVTPAGANPETLTLTPYPITTTFGSATAYPNGATPYSGGGSVRCNGNLRIYGNNQIYLDGQFGDDWEIAGNVTFDQYTIGTALATQATQTYLNGTAYDGTLFAPGPNAPNVYPSNDTANFTTLDGLIRDGNAGNDMQSGNIPGGNPRSVGRLNPPLIDSTDSVTNLTRYQVLTKQAANQFFTAGAPATASANAAPATVYVSNSQDAQTETQLLGSPTTLREEWLRTSPTALNWIGNFYTPPGVLITFGQITDASLPTTTPATIFWGVTLTRSDKDATGNPINWPGTNSTTVRLVYSATPAPTPTFDPNNPIYFLNVNSAPSATPPTSNDIVIYADGNVRVRGVVSDPAVPAGGALVPAQHVTIVTNGTAYVEGSILHGIDANTPNVLAAQPTASIALLAKQYVCLNTTQFTLGAQDFTGANQPDTTPGIPGDYFLDFKPADTLTSNLLLPTVYPNEERLYVSEQSEDTAASVTTATGDYSVADSATPPTVPAAFPPAPAGTPLRTTTTLSGFTFATGYDEPFSLTFRTDPTEVNNWLLERAAVLPADVKIQAILYAQDNSFFVIPGEWFNSDTSDAFQPITSGGNTIYTTRSNPAADPRFPYHGQPIDMQITIQGSITENMTADIADQAAWMQKWGWIPRYHGSEVGSDGTTASGAEMVPTTHQNTFGSPAVPTVGVGLNFVYDPQNGFPVVNPGALPSTSNNETYTPPTFVRTDVYGRALPSVPALPVSQDLLYNGQPTS